MLGYYDDKHLRLVFARFLDLADVCVNFLRLVTFLLLWHMFKGEGYDQQALINYALNCHGKKQQF